MSLVLAVERLVTGLAGCCAAPGMRAEDLKRFFLLESGKLGEGMLVAFFSF